jgi:rhodanese-related sulfurtransferase
MRVKGDGIDTVLAEANVILLDVREPWELEKYGAREGYINIPIGQLDRRLNELPKDKTILTA